MTNAELIDGLRCCAESTNVIERCDIEDCPYHSHSWSCIDDMLREAADALEAAEQRIAELEAQLPKECEFKRNSDKIPNARNRYCTQCGAYLSDEEFENHTIRYCYWCGSKVKGEKTDGSV